MVRDRYYKYVWNATAEDELYDLAADPGELINLATRGELAGELARLRGRLLHWMEATGDPLLNGWIREQLRLGRKV
jgi:arylsulfatase A-like enzyme